MAAIAQEVVGGEAVSGGNKVRVVELSDLRARTGAMAIGCSHRRWEGEEATGWSGEERLGVILWCNHKKGVSLHLQL